MRRTALSLAVLGLTLALALEGQRVSLGVGVLLSDRPSEPAFDVHVDSPPFHRTRAEFTASWNDKSIKPTLITEVERSIIASRWLAFDAGAGLIWVEPNDYRPWPAIISTTVVPLPVPRGAIVAVASTQPFQDFEWSLVLKASVSLLSGR